jgi:hypothetical protein
VFRYISEPFSIKTSLLNMVEKGGEEKLRIAIINPDKCKPKKCK